MPEVFACGSWKGVLFERDFPVNDEVATPGEGLAFAAIEALMKVLEPDEVTIHPLLMDSARRSGRQTVTRESPTQIAKRLGFDKLKLKVGNVEQTVL